MGQVFFKITGTGTPMTVSFCPNPKSASADIGVHIITLEGNDSRCGYDVKCVNTTTTAPVNYNSSVSQMNDYCASNRKVKVLNWTSDYGATYYTVFQGFINTQIIFF